MFQKIKSYSETYANSFSEISEERKILLNPIAEYVAEKVSNNSFVNLNFICTHNSRRSLFSQVWAAVAACYYGVKNVSTFSGGTEVTAVHPNIIASLKRHGFEIKSSGENENPVFKIAYSNDCNSIKGFSKLFDDAQNPSKNFAAIMVCESAAQNCPFVPGAEKRFPLNFEDPKIADGTPQQDLRYDSSCDEIAAELFYIFQLVKQSI